MLLRCGMAQHKGSNKMDALLSDVATQAATKLVAAVDDLLDATAGSKLAIPEDDLGHLRSSVQSARTGFPLLWKECASHEVNRLGSVLLGPVFTSAAHPWPSDEDGNPMVPLCQLNSAQFPLFIEGVDGLVQVWLTQSDGGYGNSLIRVVPTSDADVALMTPVIQHDEAIDVLLPEAADWLRDFHSGPKPSKNQYITAAAVKLGHASADELAEANSDEWDRLANEYDETYGDDVVACMQITDFDDGRVYCNITADQRNAIVSLEKLRNKLEKNGTPSDDAIVRLLTNTCSAFKAWIEHVGDQTYPSFLGTFQEIQYRAADKDASFICFENIGMREWGEGGNAQVFYSKDNGFSFDWSCS